MQHETAKQWFLRKFSRDLFVITSVTWVIMFLMEKVKPGIVSNYFSLPHAAILIVVFAIVAMVFQDAKLDIHSKGLSKTDVSVLAVFSVLLIVFEWFLFDISKGLVLLIIIVSLVALWFGTIILKNNVE